VASSLRRHAILQAVAPTQGLPLNSKPYPGRR